MIGAPYASVADLEARLGREDDSTFAALLDAASRAVESFTRRQFHKADAASPRRYRPLDRERVAVDDFWTLDDLEVDKDGQLLDVDTQIDVRPWNGIVHGQTGWPYSDLFAVGHRWRWSRRAKLTVTAWWGWAEVPEAIRQATLDVAVVMSFGVGGRPAGPVRAVAIDGYSESYATTHLGGLPDEDAPPELRKAVPYRRRIFGVG